MPCWIVVGSENCPTQKLARIINHSEDFHLFYQKWSAFAADLEVTKTEVEKLRLALLSERRQLSDVVHDVISIWVGQNGSKATLETLTSALQLNDLGSIAEKLNDEFQLKNCEWEVPSYYIQRTVISRNIFNSGKLIKELQTSKDIFVFDGANPSSINNILQTNMAENSTRIIQEESICHNYILLDYPTHFSKICKKASVPVHLIRADKDKWVHVKSNGNLSAMRNLITEEDSFTETELINSLESEVHPVCISDSPGMGKSTLLQNIGRQLSKNRKVLFATMNEFVAIFKERNDLEFTFSKLFCKNAAQMGSLSTKLNSQTMQIELLLDGLDEVSSTNLSFAFDLLKNLSTIPSIRVWVTTRPHLLHQIEETLNVFGHNILAFSKENQITFLKNFWLLQSKTLVEERVEQFAQICLSELNSKMSSRDEDIAGIPLQCLLIAEVFQEQAEEHSAPTNPNKSWIIQINSLIELYQKLIEKQFSKVNLDHDLTEITNQHVRLAVQLIFPEMSGELPDAFQGPVNLNELLNIGLLEKSSTALEPKFIHRTIAEFFIAQFLVKSSGKGDFAQTLLKRTLARKEKSVDVSINGLRVRVYTPTCYFLNSEICHFLDSFLIKYKTQFSLDFQHNYKEIFHACVFGDYFHLYKAVKSFCKTDPKIITKELLYLAVCYSGLSFLKTILENNPFLFIADHIKFKTFLLCIKHGQLQQLQYLLNVKNLRDFVKTPYKFSKLIIHVCTEDSLFDSSFLVKQKTEILRILLDLNSELLEQRDGNNLVPVLCPSVHPDLLIELIDKKANIFVKDSLQNTILHIQYTHLDVLLQHLSQQVLKDLINLKNLKGETPLMSLLQKKEPTLESLIKFKDLGANFNCEDNQGYSLLAICVFKHRAAETVLNLVELGADVNWRKGWKRKSLLHYAAESANVNAMRLLIHQFKMDINGKDLSFKSAMDYLMEGFEERGLWTTKGVVNYSVNLLRKLNVGVPPKIKINLLKESVKFMNYPSVEFLLTEGSDFVEKNKRWGIVKMLLYFFERDSGIKIIKSLINFGLIENVDNSLVVTTSSKKFFLLHEAVEKGNIKILKCLIEDFKQNVNTVCDGKTPLQVLVQSGSLDWGKAKLLVNNGADTKNLDKNGNSLLHYAVLKVKFEAVEWCLKLTADVNEGNANGESPLHKAVSVSWYCKSLVSLLCGHGANVLQVDKKGWNSLHHLANHWNMSKEVLNYLLEKGLNINAVDNEGNTPLHIVANNFKKGKDDKRVEYFLEKGTDKTIRNKNGKTPYQICKHEILQ